MYRSGTVTVPRVQWLSRPRVKTMFERAGRLQWSVLAAVVAVGLPGCQQAAGVDEAAAVNDAPVPVQPLRVQASPHPITADLPGRLAPVRIAEVRAACPV